MPAHPFRRLYLTLVFVVVIPIMPSLLIMIVKLMDGWNDDWERQWPWLFAFPAFFIAVTVTNPWHHLFMSSFTYHVQTDGTLVSFVPGPLMYIYLAASYALFIVALYYLVGRMRSGSRRHRNQALLITMGSIIPMLGDALFYSPNNPLPGATLTPALFTIGCLFFWFAIKYLGIFDLMPMASTLVWENSPDGIIIIDQKGNLHNVNKAASGSFRWASTESLGKRIDQIVTREDLRFLFTGPVPAVADNIPGDMDDRIFRGKAFLLTEVGEEALGRLVIFYDVTSEKNVQRKTEEMNDLLLKLLEDAPFAITITDMDTGAPMFFNSRTESLLQIKAAEKDKYTSFGFYVNPDDRRRLVEQIVREGEVKDFEVQLQNSKGERFWAYMSGTVIVISAKRWLFTSINDISPLKHLDELRTANRKLNLLGSITRHDLMNKYMVMAGYLQLLKDSRDRKDLDEIIEKLTRSSLEAQRLITFAGDYDRLGTGMPSWFTIGSIFQNASMQLDLKEVVVDIRGSDVQIFADPMIDRALYNLLDDSLRHGDGVRNIRIIAEPSRAFLRIIYEDDGNGIDPAIRPFLFQRGKGKNTGLGLFLTREILDMTSITIVEEGEAGKGVRFILTVPAGNFKLPSGPVNT